VQRLAGSAASFEVREMGADTGGEADAEDHRPAVAPRPPRRTDRHDALETLTASIRDLIEASVATGEGADELRSVALEVDALAERLTASRDDDPWTARSYGPGLADVTTLMGINPAIGRCNPTAPLVDLEIAEDASVSGTVRFGLSHVGPPYRAHGGVIASLFDQILGIAPIAAGSPGMTRSLSVTYRRATPLDTDLRFEAAFEGTDGRTSRASGVIRDLDGRVTAEAEATFVQPRSAR
jgi:acyl-coenzyme A thioesterase PaaI-like protein